MKRDLEERLFQFAVRCIKYLRLLPVFAEYKLSVNEKFNIIRGKL